MPSAKPVPARQLSITPGRYESFLSRCLTTRVTSEADSGEVADVALDQGPHTLGWLSLRGGLLKSGGAQRSRGPTRTIDVCPRVSTPEGDEDGLDPLDRILGRPSGSLSRRVYDRAPSTLHIRRTDGVAEWSPGWEPARLARQFITIVSADPSRPISESKQTTVAEPLPAR